jgi:hypothetical protein
MGNWKSTIPIIAILAACEIPDGEEAVSETELRQAAAARNYCVGETLARTAREDLALLETTLTDAPAVAASVTAFARAFLQHAELRETVFALEDSAYNHAATPADSTRYAQQADQFEVTLPEEGTLEANVMADYDRKANEILADTLHVCHWRHEIGTD